MKAEQNTLEIIRQEVRIINAQISDAEDICRLIRPVWEAASDKLHALRKEKAALIERAESIITNQ